MRTKLQKDSTTNENEKSALKKRNAERLLNADNATPPPRLRLWKLTKTSVFN